MMTMMTAIATPMMIRICFVEIACLVTAKVGDGGDAAYLHVLPPDQCQHG